MIRLLGAGWRLVADDRVVVWTSGGRAFGRAPGPLAGLVELRGQAVASTAALDLAPVTLVADLAADADRQPEPRLTDIAGTAVAHHALRGLDASAAHRLRLLIAALV